MEQNKDYFTSSYVTHTDFATTMNTTINFLMDEFKK